MRRLDGSVTEVLFDPEQVDPTFRYRIADAYVLARNLTVLATREAGH